MVAVAAGEAATAEAATTRVPPKVGGKAQPAVVMGRPLSFLKTKKHGAFITAVILCTVLSKVRRAALDHHLRRATVSLIFLAERLRPQHFLGA